MLILKLTVILNT